MSSTGRPRTAAAVRRRQREQQILDATRRLFDDSGVRDAQIDDVARAVGVNRAIIYRHFSGKEELFALALVSYLDELQARLAAASAEGGTAAVRLDRLVGAFVDYGVEYPAFIDCASTLMSRSGPELFEELSEGALLRLGRAISSCLSELVGILEDGKAAGELKKVDSAVFANHMYASGLGALQLARVGLLVKESAPGVPAVIPLSAEQVKQYLIATARTLAVR